jgi:hypothetical protein
MIRTIIKDRLTNEVLYGPADFADQSQVDAWLAIRFPQENRSILKSEAQLLHGEDYTTFLIEEVIENIDGEDVLISVLRPLTILETEDVSAEYAAIEAKKARMEAGKQARQKCIDALDVIAGWNLERELTPEQITEMQTTFSTILITLQANRPDSAKALINDIVVDDVLVTEEMKTEILSVL